MTTDEMIQAIEALPDHERRGILAFFKVDANEPVVFCLSPDLKALAAELKLYREFVGAMHEYKIEKLIGRWSGGQFCIFHNWKIIATGTDPFDAWRNMQNLPPTTSSEK